MTAFVPSISKLSERVIRVLALNPGMMTLQGTNTYILGKGKRRFLLDTGDGTKPEYIELLKTTLAANDSIIEAIIVTHWHNDHIGGLSSILNAFKNDYKVYKVIDKHDDCKDLKLYPVKDNQIFKLEDITLRLLHTPGHTEDHLAVYLEEEKALFSGDCILGEGTSVFTDLWSYMNSLRRFLSLKMNVIYPGHGPIIENPIEKVNEYILHRERREQQILNCLPHEKSEAIAIESLVEVVYKDTPIQLHSVAANNARLHLAKLVKEGRVGITEGDYTKYWIK
ncbi:hypothetical protein B4U79_12821 [Dinothrombium tinctorium]|uniref:Beta-lactamase-like protein 2 homolog n=1 Tax=Dinothrombium tinctorium TaxID=1965070 RepID=A0A443RNG3_9ACAR|nr:hypothetical protein B4U79_12821 [Dinothrombium tinctorium]